MNTPQSISPAELVSARRTQLEQDALTTQAEISLWLQIANIALPAVLRAADTGNIRCKAAVEEMKPLLAKTKAFGGFNS